MMRNMFFARDPDPAARPPPGELLMTQFFKCHLLDDSTDFELAKLLCQSVTSSQLKVNGNSILHENFSCVVWHIEINPTSHTGCQVNWEIARIPIGGMKTVRRLCC